MGRSRFPRSIVPAAISVIIIALSALMYLRSPDSEIEVLTGGSGGQIDGVRTKEAIALRQGGGTGGMDANADSLRSSGPSGIVQLGDKGERLAKALDVLWTKNIRSDDDGSGPLSDTLFIHEAAKILFPIVRGWSRFEIEMFIRGHRDIDESAILIYSLRYFKREDLLGLLPSLARDATLPSRIRTESIVAMALPPENSLVPDPDKAISINRHCFWIYIGPVERSEFAFALAESLFDNENLMDPDGNLYVPAGSLNMLGRDILDVLRSSPRVSQAVLDGFASTLFPSIQPLVLQDPDRLQDRADIFFEYAALGNLDPEPALLRLAELPFIHFKPAYLDAAVRCGIVNRLSSWAVESLDPLELQDAWIAKLMSVLERRLGRSLTKTVIEKSKLAEDDHNHISDVMKSLEEEEKDVSVLNSVRNSLEVLTEIKQRAARDLACIWVKSGRYAEACRLAHGSIDVWLRCGMYEGLLYYLKLLPLDIKEALVSSLETEQRPALRRMWEAHPIKKARSQRQGD